MAILRRCSDGTLGRDSTGQGQFGFKTGCTAIPRCRSMMLNCIIVKPQLRFGTFRRLSTSRYTEQNLLWHRDLEITETGFVSPGLPRWRASIIHAEIYPSLVPIETKQDKVKDCGQVRQFAEHFLRIDREGSLNFRNSLKTNSCS
jgi:hypothetical protein